MARALIGLGANLGNREQSLAAATRRLASAPDTRLLASSDWLRTRPVGGPAGQEYFLNGAALVETRLSPPQLLDVLLAIETAFGRERSQRWAPRTLDLDLLLYDDRVLRSETLELPHPGLAFRRFMLEPAAQIAADMTHPRIGWTLDHLLKHLDSTANYLAILGGDHRFRTALAADVARQAGATTVSDAATAVQSGGQALELPSALELLRLRGERLATAANENRIVSDFWWNDFPSLVGDLGEADAEIALAAWRMASPKIAPPRLLIVLDDNSKPPGAGGDSKPPGAGGDSKPPGATTETAGGSLARRVLSRPGNGPFLRIKTPCSLAQAAIEASAAFEAMQ